MLVLRNPPLHSTRGLTQRSSRNLPQLPRWEPVVLSVITESCSSFPLAIRSLRSSKIHPNRNQLKWRGSFRNKPLEISCNEKWVKGTGKNHGMASLESFG